MGRDAQGRSISPSKNDEKNIAGVEYVEYQQLETGKIVMVVLSTMPMIRNYAVGDNLVINAKGTMNSNSDYTVKVVSVVGPMKYKCEFVAVGLTG
jgi:hypothetical protein